MCTSMLIISPDQLWVRGASGCLYGFNKSMDEFRTEKLTT